MGEKKKPVARPADEDARLDYGDDSLVLDYGEGVNVSSGAVPVDDLFGEAEETGTIDGDMRSDLERVKSAFEKSRGDAREMMRNLDDSEFWFCVIFETRDQKEAFLRLMGWLDHADKYLDGHVLAAKQGFVLPDSDLRPLPPKPDRKLTELAHPLDPG